MEKIESTFGKTRIYQRVFKKQVVITFRPDPQITLENLRAQIEDVFTTVEPETFMPQKQVVKQRSLKEIIDDIASRVKRFVQVHFHELISGTDRREHAVSFLAVLELFRQGEIDLEQDGHFEKIKLTNKNQQSQSAQL